MATIQTRSDILFQFDHTKLGGTNYRFFNLNEFIVRVEKLITGADNEVRYGIMIDFDNDLGYQKKSYILEIPAPAASPKIRQQKQEEVIKKYIDEMRGKFKSHYSNATQAGTTDEFDQVQRKLFSADGQWSILRDFRKDHLIGFSEWVFKTKFSSKQEIENYLVKNKMSFETGREYLISTDWACPYICYEKDYKISHFATDLKTDTIFYPFHNFYWQNMDLCTKVSISRDTDYAAKYPEGIDLKPANYSLFAYYTFLIDNICSLQNKNYQQIKIYYQYVQNLSAIQQAMLSNGPLKKMSERDIGKLNIEARKDWDGDTSDGAWGGNNTTDFALGISDIGELIQLFTGVIAQESKSGRNANRSVEIESLAYALNQSFLDNQVAMENYTDLWCHNGDVFGVDLIIRKLVQVICQMPCASDIYNKYLIKNLYEHPVLEDTHSGANKPGLDFSEWGNIFYRTNIITFETWTAFYHVREAVLGTNGTKLTASQIASKTPHSGDIAKWITAVSVFPNAVAGSSTPSQLYDNWRLSDAQSRKLANHLLGGSTDAKIQKIEEALIVEIKRLFGTVDFKEIPFDRIDELHEILLKLKNNLIESTLPEAKMTALGHKANIGASALNFYLATLAYSNASSVGSSVESKLRAHTIALGLFSDVANTTAKFRGIQSTLLRSVAIRAGGRVALGLGALELVGGGVGGILGVGWFAFDAWSNLDKGRGKDGLLDTISAIGCAIATIGLFLDGSVIGMPIGVLANIIGVSMVLVSQLLKYFRAFSSKSEDYCSHLFGESESKGGADLLRKWQSELENSDVHIPIKFFTSYSSLTELTDRTIEFMTDWDTFDQVTSP